MTERPCVLCHLSIIGFHSCTFPCFVHRMTFHHICVNQRVIVFGRKAVCYMPPFDYRGAPLNLYDPCLSPWYLYFSKRTPPCRRVYPPPSGRHAKWCLYVIGRDSWVRDMPHVLARLPSFHGVGVGSIICSVATCRSFIGSSPP